MILRELKQGQRFEFQDKVSPVILQHNVVPLDAKGSFEYLGQAQWACPALRHEMSGLVFIAAAGMYERYVFAIVG